MGNNDTNMYLKVVFRSLFESGCQTLAYRNGQAPGSKRNCFSGRTNADSSACLRQHPILHLHICLNFKVTVHFKLLLKQRKYGQKNGKIA